MKWIVMIFITLLFFSCEENEELEYISIFTEKVSILNDSTAFFSAKIKNTTDITIPESGFIWSIRPEDNDGLKIQNHTNSLVYTLQTNHSLLPGKTFYVRAYLNTGNKVVFGRELSFETEGQIDYGNWSEEVNESGSKCDLISSSFTINGRTYFLLSEGEMYRYDHLSKDFSFVISNDLFRNASFSTVYKNRVFFFSGNSLYNFNTENLSIIKLSSWPVEHREGIVGFRIDDKIIIGLGESEVEYSKGLWKYNIPSDIWEPISDFPGDFRKIPYSFVLDSMGFVGGGYNLIFGQWPYPKFNDLWRYNPSEDTWMEMESLSFENQELYALIGTNLNNKGYCFYQNELYEYNSVYDFWEKMQGLNAEGFCYPHFFNYEDKLFIADISTYLDTKFLKLYSYAK